MTSYVYLPPAVADDTFVAVDVPSFHPTVYRSDELAGVLDWKDTPRALVSSVASAPLDLREQRAADYLGKVPAGGWEATFEREHVSGDRRELWFRSVEPSTVGEHALIILRPREGGEALPALSSADRVLVTGRLAEICVDDPFEQAGKLTLEDGSIKR